MAVGFFFTLTPARFLVRVPLCLSCCLVELEDVVGGADHGPFASDLVEPSEEELSEASGLLDLTEYRLGGVFSQPISATSPSVSDLVGHCLHQGLSFEHTPGCGIGLAMPDAAGREIGPDAALCHGGQIGFGSKARIARNLEQITFKWKI